MNPIVSAQGLEKRFRSLDALRGLDLEVPEGSVYSLIGPNGAGKTTAFRILMNLMRPSAGSAWVLGREASKLGPEDFTRIGYVSEGQDMPAWMTVGYFLDYLAPFYPNWDSQRAAQLLGQFDLPADRKLAQLSRGMRMKAALVSSLAYRPQLLLLDEPFSGLDPMVREDLIEALVESAEETTILISSHDLAEIESFSSHVAYLEDGRLRFAESMASLTERFREVEVTLTTGADAREPANWPEGWLRPERTPSFVRFVETRFDADRTSEQIRRLFGSGANIALSPMPLRSIFVTMARHSRRSTEGVGA
jgi:ABC-2 type transport system ATP-binding protein